MAMTKKEALLKAAKELFGECGYTETTFKKISERAGVALGLLTHHYGNKEKLFLAAGMDVLERFHEVLQRACDEGKNGRESVLNFCKAYLDLSRLQLACPCALFALQRHEDDRRPRVDVRKVQRHSQTVGTAVVAGH